MKREINEKMAKTKRKKRGKGARVNRLNCVDFEVEQNTHSNRNHDCKNEQLTDRISIPRSSELDVIQQKREVVHFFFCLLPSACQLK